MPFPLRPINPTHISKTANPDETHNPLEYVTNATLTQAIQQMASLICQANDLFEDLAEQCHTINQSTKTINERVLKLAEKVENYNPKKEMIRKLLKLKMTAQISV